MTNLTNSSALKHSTFALALICANVVIWPQVLSAQHDKIFDKPISKRAVSRLEIEEEEFFFHGDLQYEDIGKGSTIGRDSEGRVRSLVSHSSDEEAIIRQIRSSPFLVELNLEFAIVSEKVVIVTSENCPVLEEVYLGMPEDTYGEAGKFTNDSLKYLSKLNHLRIVKIRSNKINDEGVKVLKKLPFLRELDLTGCNITDNSVNTFKGLHRLSEIVVFGTKMTKIRLDEFGKIRPKISVRYGCLK